MKIGKSVISNIQTGSSSPQKNKLYASVWCISALILLLLLIVAGGVWAKNIKKKSRHAKREIVYIIHADVTAANQTLMPHITILRGNVKLRHKGMYMKCDSAYLDESTNTFDAYDHVYMYQGDTLKLWGDFLRYDGYKDLAMLRHNCKLVNRGTTLLTDSLNYDRSTDLAYYFEGGTMLESKNILTSEWGQFCPSTKDSKFLYGVKLANPQYTLSTDTLHFNTASGLARIVGPSKIDSRDNHIVADRGWYNTHTNKSQLTNRPLLFTDNGKTLRGDTVFYNRAAGYCIAHSNAILTDTVRKNILEGGYLYYNQLKDSALATGHALATDYSQGDSIYMHADTMKLITFRARTDSAYRQMHAYHKVRIYKKDFQAVCDSLMFSSADSCMRLYKDPILWNQQQQQLGEEVHIFFNDSTIDRVKIINQALSVAQKDSIHYNQTAGNKMEFFFASGTLEHLEVTGNVKLNYYPEDSGKNGEKDMMGMNYSESSFLVLWMRNKKIHRMRMTPRSTGSFYPMLMIPNKSLYLDNFGWFDYVRPLNKEDVFNWRGKKQGSELVYKIRKPMPLPNRGLQKTIKNNAKSLPTNKMPPTPKPVPAQKVVPAN